MKKAMKKITAILATAAIAAIPMAGSLTANAAPAGYDDPKFFFGDLDHNKQISAWDATLILRAAQNNGANLSSADKIRADVDADGVITQADAQLTLEYYVTNVVAQNDLYGDADNDGDVDMNDAYTVYDYVHGELGSGLGADNINLIAADVNGDGVINTFDHVLISRYDLGRINSLYVNWGDVTDDGSVDIADQMVLFRFLAEDRTAHINDAGRRRADLNLNGNIDSQDLQILMDYISNRCFIWR
ncbi:dockerin type I domain-containing protein [uncultured Ruminococcus sp.]|uniref:dockerin type I domain-containing protein n=1 Tax=uncultured Ruminococcus sp. TaxID=165186 RepID=UPI002601A522|nr:dockerin type I domain-containing protein [uncultured Ruminococcus sp.]